MPGRRPVITISKLNADSIEYYEGSVSQQAGRADRTRADGAAYDRNDYYSEQGDAVPTMFAYAGRQGDEEAFNLAMLMEVGADHGQAVEADQARNFLTEQLSMDGEEKLGRETEVTGYDMTFAVPKSVSLLWMKGDDAVKRAIEEEIAHANRVGMNYLADHAGYTRVNDAALAKARGKQTKVQVKLQGLAGLEYQHHTSRAGEPHLHSHMLVSNKQLTADGRWLTIDGKALYNETRAAGMMQNARLMSGLSQRLGVMWGEPDIHSGTREMVGIDRKTIEAWSTRHSEVSDWLKDRTDGTAGTKFADGRTETNDEHQRLLAAGQKATRRVKDKEHPSLTVTLEQWRDDPRSQEIDLSRVLNQRTELVAAVDAIEPDELTILAHLAINKSRWTRQDVVEMIGTLWPTTGDPKQVAAGIEAKADAVLAHECSVSQAVDPSTLARGELQPWEREGSAKYTSFAVLAEETAASANATIHGDRRALAVPDEELDRVFEGRQHSPDQKAAAAGIARSGNQMTCLIAPAGAGKTSGVLEPLRALYEADGRTVVGLAPTGKARGQMSQDNAASKTMTVHAALQMIDGNRHGWTAEHVIFVDEAGMVGNEALARLIGAARQSGAKLVGIGDPEQLAPVNQRGGLFQLLCEDNPDTQELTEVFRQERPEEAAAALMLRNGTETERAIAAGWYAANGQVRSGSQTSMMNAGTDAWTADRRAGMDSLLLTSTNENVHALNHVGQADHRRLRWTAAYANKFGCSIEEAEKVYNPAQHSPTNTASLGFHRSRGLGEESVAIGEPIITRHGLNSSSPPSIHNGEGGFKFGEPVANGDRWTVRKVNEDGSVIAQRGTDGATTILNSDYLREHCHLGYAGTIHSVQGAKADTVHGALDADTTDRSLIYTLMSRGVQRNTLYLYERMAGEDAHGHREVQDHKDTQRWRQREDDQDTARQLMIDCLDRNTKDETALKGYERERTAQDREQPVARAVRDADIADGSLERTPMEKTHDERQAQKAKDKTAWDANTAKERERQRKKMAAAAAAAQQDASKAKSKGAGLSM